MASFSKKFNNPKNENTFIYATWETEYNNLKVYYDGQIVETITNPRDLLKGVTTEVEGLGKMRLKFTAERPITLEVQVDGTTYLTQNKLNEAMDLSGPSTMFYTIAGFGIVATILAQLALRAIPFMPDSIILAQLIFDLVVISGYIVCAIFVRRQAKWAYFAGTALFILMSIYYSYLTYIQGFALINIIVILIRIGMIVYLATFLKSVVNMQARNLPRQDDLLDEFELDE